jgi:hypothetical protein
MTTFVAILPHAAGVFTAQEVEITGTTLEELRDNAWAECIGSRYVGRIVAVIDGRSYTVYSESGGWRIDDPADEAAILALTPG